MEYRAVGNRCAVNIESLGLPMPSEKALAILARKGFTVVEVDMVALARRCIGISRYRRGARLAEAPTVVDCSSFVKWLYAQRGIWLPRLAVQQREYGGWMSMVSVDQPNQLMVGDLVFVFTLFGFHRDNPADGVSHVGIYTDKDTVIHAQKSSGRVIETSLDEFIGGTQVRGARRYIPQDAEVITLQIPVDVEVETADDIRWIILQSLPKNPHYPRE